VEHLFSTDRPVTLITTFHLREGASVNLFVSLWVEVGKLMVSRSGYVSSRLYRATVGDGLGEYIHVAEWTSAVLLADAQADPHIRSLHRELEPLLLSRRRTLCEPATDTMSRLD
jgi:hypothetical protein